MNRFVIGVDGGASKTVAVVADMKGEVLGRGWGGSCNHYLVGLDGIKESISNAIQSAVESAGIDVDDVAAATWALAGIGRPATTQLINDLRSEMLPGIPGQVVNDAIAALVGGVGTRHGIVLIAGTGMIAYGENAAGKSARSGGWGHLLDHGSGYDLAQEALRTAAHSTEDNSQTSTLFAEIRDQLNLLDMDALVAWIYAPDRSVADIAALAPTVLSAAEAGDLQATGIVARAADALADAVNSVARRLGFWEQRFPLVMSGGLFATNDYYRKVAAQAVSAQAPFAHVLRPRADAAVGAAMLALENLGYPLVSPDDFQETYTGTWISEQRNILTLDLDLRSTQEIVGLMHLEDRRAALALAPNLPAIAKLIDAVASRMRQGGRLIYIGAGTSGRIGTMDASECPPTFGTDPDQVISIVAGGVKALTSSIEAAEDNADSGADAIAKLNAGENDSVVGIAASGRTPFVAGALKEARSRGALTAAVINNLPAPLADMADHVIAPLVGPEVLTGSTRLKAGTTQKMVLNMLSTGVMIRLGKTYGNLMVDLGAINIKLQERARRIVAQACDIGEDEAEQVLADCQGDVKVAIVSTLLDCSVLKARERLERSAGEVRTALVDL